MHTTLIRHVKDISSLPAQLLWAVFHQISRQLAAGTSGNLRQTATNHAKIDSISHRHLMHPSSEGQTSQEALGLLERVHSDSGHTGEAAQASITYMCTCSQRDVRFAVLGLEEAGSYDMTTTCFLAKLYNAVQSVSSYPLGPPATPTTAGGGELNFCACYYLSCTVKDQV